MAAGAAPAGLAIAPFATDEEARDCAALMAASDPWVTLGSREEDLLAFLRDASRERYVARLDGALAGFLVLNLAGAFTGYLQAVGVAPALRGRGIGTRLVAFAEERIFRDHANVFLCVSAFNAGARALYERLGYEAVGRLDDYLVAGRAEILMRKTRGPIAAVRAARRGLTSPGG